MIYKVPVVRYLGFNQSSRQSQRFGRQSSQISDHCVALGADHPHIGFQKKTCPPEQLD